MLHVLGDQVLYAYKAKHKQFHVEASDVALVTMNELHSVHAMHDIV